MKVGEVIRKHRKIKNMTQEELAERLGVTAPAVNKWENGNTYPDITLLPDIARFFGITVDELLQVDILDEEHLYREYEEKASLLFHEGRRREALETWQEAYRKMPNNIKVKEMLMSAYYDADRSKYRDIIIDLGTEIYNSDADMYYKSQAIRGIANTYAANGSYELAAKWVKRAVPIFNSQEILFSEIDDGEALINDVSFCTYWFLNELFYMMRRIAGSDSIVRGKTYMKELFEKISCIFETVYTDDDMDFEEIKKLCYIHTIIAEYGAGANDEEMTRKHLSRVLKLSAKSLHISKHRLTSPLIDGWNVLGITDGGDEFSTQIAETFSIDIKKDVFAGFMQKEWYSDMCRQVTEMLR